MSFGSAEAFQADVVFRASAAQFDGDMAQIRAAAERTYGAIDQGSLKAALASEKYDRAIARSKGSAYAVAKATATYKSELASLEGAENRAAGGAARHSGALKAEERAIGGVIRGGIAGSGVLNRFGRAAIFASSSLLGGYGLVYGLRTVVNAAREQEVALAHLQVAVTDTGLSWTGTRGRLDDALASLVKTTAFTRDDLTETLATAVRRFGDVDEALNATGIATEVARAKGIDLASAMNLLIRASLGQSKSVKALGVDISATTTHLDKLRATTAHATVEQIANAKAADQQANRTAYLDAIQAHYHGNAAKYLQTSAGKQQLFNAELHDTEEIIGGALLPTLNTYLGELSDWLEKMNKSGQLQHDVNTVVHDAAGILHAAGAAAHFLTSNLGGVKNTLELIAAFKLTRWALGAARSFGLLGGSAVAANGEVVALRASLLGISGMTIAPIVIPLVVDEVIHGKHGLLSRAATAGSNAVADALGVSTSDNGQGPTYQQFLKASKHHDATYEIIERYMKQRGLTDPRMLRGGPLAPKNTSGMSNDPVHDANDRRSPPITSGGGSTTGAGASGDATGAGGGLPYGGPFGQNALLEAQGTPGTADDLKVLNDQLGYLNKALAQKGLSPQDRNQLLNERNDVLSQREQILQASATARKQAADAAARKQKQHFTGLTQVPAVLVKRFADAEAAHKPASVLEKIRREEEAALRRQERELKKEGAPETYIAKVAKELDTIQARIDAATRKARKDRIAKLDQVPVGLQLEEANAIANNASAERLASIYRKEKDALDKQLAQLKKIHATKQEILKNRQAAAAVEKKLTAIEKQQKADTGALARELQDAVAGLAQYAPNVTAALASIQGGPKVDVHQHFPHPPTADGSREATFARHAMLAAFDG